MVDLQEEEVDLLIHLLVRWMMMWPERALPTRRTLHWMIESKRVQLEGLWSPKEQVR